MVNDEREKGVQTHPLQLYSNITSETHIKEEDHEEKALIMRKDEEVEVAKFTINFCRVFWNLG